MVRVKFDCEIISSVLCAKEAFERSTDIRGNGETSVEKEPPRSGELVIPVRLSWGFSVCV
jgi:hypothetical protein